MSTELKENFEKGHLITWLQVHNVAAIAIAVLISVLIGYLFFSRYAHEVQTFRNKTELNRLNVERIDRTINALMERDASLAATIEPLIPTTTPTPRGFKPSVTPTQ